MGETTEVGAAKLKSGRLPPDPTMWAGIAALAVAVLLILEFTIRTSMGPRPDLDDPVNLADFVERTNNLTLTIILIDTLMMAALIVFMSGFREVITKAHSELTWIANIVFGAGIAFVTITLVGDSLEAGGALDTVGSNPEPIAIRALTEGYMPLFGPMGAVLIALIAAASGYASIASGALPKWTGYFSYAVAIVNIAAAPTIYGGTNDRDFYSVGGWGVAAFATFPWLAWVIVVGVVAIRSRRRAAD